VGNGTVKVEIFTVAFRKVLTKTFENVLPGQSVPVTLTDNWGRPLAGGIYYVVVTVDGHRLITKLLVIN
jgi:hypothetical protein